MSAITHIPEVVNNFNAYTQGNILVGLANSVTIPPFEAITETISGAGILGEYDTAIPGFYGSMSQECVFRTLDTDIFSLMNPSELVDLTFRSSLQHTERSTGSLDWKGMRIAERGRLKNFNPGVLELGKQMGASVTLELLYILIEINGETKVEYDKLNDVFIVDGKDLLEKVRSFS